MPEIIQNFDFAVLDFIAEHMQCTFLDKLMPFITSLADAGWLWILLSIIFICIPKCRKMGFAMSIALVCGFIVGNITLKPLIARIRPYDINTAIELIISKPTDYSFPSGHTLASFEGAVAILLYNKKLGIPAVILASLIAFSRLYLYVHYPTDVIAGIILGTSFAFLGVFIVRKAGASYEKKHTSKNP